MSDTMDLLSHFGDKHERAVIDAKKKLRVGIIGTGWIAEAHVMEYKKMPDVEIVAGADLVEGKARAFFERMGIAGAKSYPDHASLLDSERLDAVSICTYNKTHAECAIYALEKGVNVLLEKPMCVTLEEALDILRAEKKSGKVLSVGFQPRFDPNMKMIKNIVEAGELGEVYYIQTGGGRRRGIPTPFGTTFIDAETAGIGALADIGCYSLDMVLNAVGYPKPLTVTGYKSDFFGKRESTYPHHPEYAKIFGVDDFAAAFIRLENDIILDFRIAWDMNINTPGDTIILGKKAGLRIPSSQDWNGSISGPMILYHDVAGKCAETVIPVLHDDSEGLFYNKIRSFLDAVKNGGTAPVPTSQIIYNQAIIDGIVKSSNLKREIEINIPEI